MSQLSIQHLSIRTRQIEILRDVNFRAFPGELQAIMGPSGSGKSTLLHYIAGKRLLVQARGLILVDGAEPDKRWLASNIAYVEQHNALLPTSTVRETLFFSARLQLAAELTTEQVNAAVDAVIDELELTHRADSYNGGDGLIRGLSGGERRRVSIGEQLVKDPSILLLDEPTSGLDSHISELLVRNLKTLASKGRTIVSVIHQPNSKLVDMFDRLTLMASGELIHQGTLQETEQFFISQGYPSPERYNPADHYLDVISNQMVSSQLNDEYERYNLQRLNSHHKLIKSTNNKDTLVLHQRLESAPKYFGDTLLSNECDAPWCIQQWILTKRKTLQWLRDPIMLKAELVEYIGAGLFLGAMFYGIDDSARSGTFNRISALGLVLTILDFAPAFTTITKYDNDRKLLRREVHGAMYTCSAYYMSQTLTSFLVEISMSFLYTLCFYFLVGFDTKDDKFIKFLLVVWIFTLISETIGLLCVMVSFNSTIGLLVHTPIALCMMFISGFLSDQDQNSIDWFKTINPFYYALVALIDNEFTGLKFTQEVQGQSVQVSGESLIRSNLKNGLTFWENVGVLAGMLVGLRVWGYFVLVCTVLPEEVPICIYSEDLEYPIEDWAEGVNRRNEHLISTIADNDAKTDKLKSIVSSFKDKLRSIATSNRQAIEKKHSSTSLNRRSRRRKSSVSFTIEGGIIRLVGYVSKDEKRIIQSKGRIQAGISSAHNTGTKAGSALHNTRPDDSADVKLGVKDSTVDPKNGSNNDNRISRPTSRVSRVASAARRRASQAIQDWKLTPIEGKGETELDLLTGSQAGQSQQQDGLKPEELKTSLREQKSATTSSGPTDDLAASLNDGKIEPRRPSNDDVRQAKAHDKPPAAVTQTGID